MSGSHPGRVLCAATLCAAAAVGASAAAAGAGAAEARVAAEARDTVAVGEEHRLAMARLARRPEVRRALRHIHANRSRTVEDQARLTAIPAPPFGEERRGAEFARLLRQAGADSVFVDAEGNVIGIRRGTAAAVEEAEARAGAAAAGDPGDGAAAGGAVVLSGHLDTVFPAGTDVGVAERGDTLFAPGIGDDGRGLAAVLAVLRAMEAAGLRTASDIWFVGTVGEEGLGDLRGVKHLFRPAAPEIAAFVSIDGTDPARIVNAALGSRRYRVTYRGPGGHSWGAFGLANPAHALGRAIYLFDLRADAFTSMGPETSYNVGRIGGGTSVNAVPFEAWMEVDMRSVDQRRLMMLDSLFRRTAREAREEQNEVRRAGPPLLLEMALVGDRPSGRVAADADIVQRAAASARLLGFEPVLERSSTDANVPIAGGVPAVTIGGGGEGGGAHSPEEWWRDPGDAYRGVQRALLLVLAQAGAAP